MRNMTAPSTRNFLTFANTTAIAYRQKLTGASRFWRYAIAVVFANVRKLRVQDPIPVLE